MSTYTPPQVTELGTLGALTQSLLPSTRALGGTMAALSAPSVNPSSPVDTSAPSTSSAPTATVVGGSAPSTSTVPGSGGDIGQGENLGGGEETGPPTSADAPTASVSAPTAAPAAGSGGGDLPFTGFAAGALAAIGAGLTGAGVAIRRAVRRG